MIFLNTTETIGIIMARGTTYTTGSMFLSMLILVIILLAIAVLFQIPIEFTAILILPLLLSYMAFYKEFVVVGSVVMIYLAMVFARKFLIR